MALKVAVFRIELFWNLLSIAAFVGRVTISEIVDKKSESKHPLGLTNSVRNDLEIAQPHFAPCRP